MSSSTSATSSALLPQLYQLVFDERDAALARLLDVWQQPLVARLTKGETQGFVRLEAGEEPGTAWAYPDEGQSRLREGDLLCLHRGDPLEPLCRQVTLEFEDEHCWLLRSAQLAGALAANPQGPWYADADTMDLTAYYTQALDDVGSTALGKERILPLLTGELEPAFDEEEMERGLCVAYSEGLNARQADAVGWAHGAHHVACIQGPPGTGKTRVLGLIVRLAVERGERVLVTSFTHMAINNALNAVHAQGVPVVKVGRLLQCRGLHEEISRYESLDEWEERPHQPGAGYAVGATPFATCSAARLGHYSFDTVVFDEASQITLPLALMAMRKAQRYIFIGDQQQLPPVLLSRSVLDKQGCSVFAHLSSAQAEHTVMLNETYRMNQWLTQWPGAAYYAGQLRAAGANAQRHFLLDARRVPLHWQSLLCGDAAAVFIPTAEPGARTVNTADAQQVVAICQALVNAGLPLAQVGIVSPYRAQGQCIRQLLQQRFAEAAHDVVADTVERMQGQEREVIILSLASSDPLFLTQVAEFFFQPQRLNVSITRARTKLIVIGPDLRDMPQVLDALADSSEVYGWMQQYQSLLEHCMRIELAAPV